MERMTGIEPATSAWKAEMLASTPHPHIKTLKGVLLHQRVKGHI